MEALGLALRGMGDALGQALGGYSSFPAASPSPTRAPASPLSSPVQEPPHEPAYVYIDEHGQRVILTEREARARGLARWPSSDTVEVSATFLPVAVRATILSVLVVERGNLVFLTAPFDGDPDEVYVSYLPPDERRPVVDPGYGQRGSRIERLAEGVYFYTIDTRECRGGVLQWHFWSEGVEHQKSAFGEVRIPERPAQLL